MQRLEVSGAVRQLNGSLGFEGILAHPVYKMWIIQEPNTLELWYKLHFEKKKNGECIVCLRNSVPIFVE